MPGRLWVLFGLQASAAAFCCGLSRMGGSLGGTMGMAVAMALCCTAAAGATFGIGAPPPPALPVAVGALCRCTMQRVAALLGSMHCSSALTWLRFSRTLALHAVPFITRRGLGAANGIVGSGSNAGGMAVWTGGRAASGHSLPAERSEVCAGVHPGWRPRRRRLPLCPHVPPTPALLPAGAVLLQALFFTGSKIDYAQGFLLMVRAWDWVAGWLAARRQATPPDADGCARHVARLAPPAPDTAPQPARPRPTPARPQRATPSSACLPTAAGPDRAGRLLPHLHHLVPALGRHAAGAALRALLRARHGGGVLQVGGRQGGGSERRACPAQLGWALREALGAGLAAALQLQGRRARLARSPPRPPPRTRPSCRSRDYTAAERERGLHRAVMAWSIESRSQRGMGSAARLAALDGSNGAHDAGGGGGGDGGDGGGEPTLAPPSAPSTSQLEEQHDGRGSTLHT